MKNNLQNSLIGISFLLCVLIAVQWVREARVHGQMESLTREVEAKAGALQASDGQLKRSEAEVQRLDALKVELTDKVKTNRLEITALKKELEKALADAKQIDSFKEALQQANANIKKQNEGILKLNAELKQLMAERNELAVKFSQLSADYNDLAKKWNDQQQKLSQPAPAPAK